MIGRLATMLTAALTAACTAGDVAPGVVPATAVTGGPVIDVHRHASWPGEDDEPARAAALAEMDENGIVLSLLYINEPGDVETWLRDGGGRFIGGPAMPCSVNRRAPGYRCFAETQGWPDLAWLERELRRGRIALLGEMLFVYAGISPNDPRMAPYWALAARYDALVAVHINRGPPPDSRIRRDGGCCPNFDGEMGNPALLRPVLERHPGLRIILQHVGTGRTPDLIPFYEEIFALLRDYPSVHLDMSIANSVGPPEVHERELRRLIDAGFGDRIMFGTDGQPAGPILRRLEVIDWLSAGQRRAILYDNAARFLRLTERQIRAHRRAAR
jgi:uncharacterized protein